ncbi:hypothetical protein PQ469_22125 [Mucilaginibacter sp. KACC 22773]|uniref:hypothetical protein n=1 Tax=Mucilaginibacter sp. KACC 22773 TaxID=3025671 RepID=UPI00236617A0|nr:hypothetical protein [Mucilaginibacter sp. KACC 22773]WDF76588.1 hypothetical protein PQ469_22125 [Mucilaginibacter sp. KACC 22773]
MKFFEGEILNHASFSLSPRNDDNPIEGDWDDEDDEDFDDQLDAESDLHNIQAGDAADEPDPDDDDHLPDDDLQ